VHKVGPDGTFIGGDLALSKGEDDEFEAVISDAKPGVWAVTVESTTQTAGEGENSYEEQIRTAHFVWLHEGTVDYDSLPLKADVQTKISSGDAGWEEVSGFSVDSGTASMFSKSALDALLATGEDREAMLETFLDDFNEHDGPFVPSGVVCEYQLYSHFASTTQTC
jgi:hypothetical protein